MTPPVRMCSDRSYWRGVHETRAARLRLPLLPHREIAADARGGAFGCEGISTRQHNGPAGDQDVWHYHLHVFPRSPCDGLHGGQKLPYTRDERIELAARLRRALR